MNELAILTMCKFLQKSKDKLEKISIKQTKMLI